MQLLCDGEKCILQLCLWKQAFVKFSYTHTHIHTHTHTHTNIYTQTWQQILNNVRAYRLTHFLSYSSSKQQKLDEIRIAIHRLVPIMPCNEKYQT